MARFIYKNRKSAFSIIINTGQNFQTPIYNNII